MNRFKWFLLIFAVFVFACSAEDDASEPQTIEVEKECKLNSDCKCDDSSHTPDCQGGECVCIPPAEAVGCTVNSDCTEWCGNPEATCDAEEGSCNCNPDCTDNASCAEHCTDEEEPICKSNGTCTCKLTVVKEYCTTAEECTTCNEGDAVTCENGNCVCSRDVVVTKESCQDVSECGPCLPGYQASCTNNQCYCTGSQLLPNCTIDAECTPFCTTGEAECVENEGVKACVCNTKSPSCETVADCKDCPQGTQVSCLGKVCYCQEEVEKPVPTCTTSGDCEQFCSEDATQISCETFSCVCVEPGPSCTVDANCTDCPPNTTASCVGTQCYCMPPLDCSADADCALTCPLGSVPDCVGSLCQCLVPKPCTADSECSCDAGLEPACNIATGICHCNQPPPPPDSIIIAMMDFNPDRLVVEGSQGLVSQRFLVFGTSASNPLDDLKFNNDPLGTGAVSTNAISQIHVDCNKPDGTPGGPGMSNNMTGGVSHLSGLGCHDETGNGLIVTVTYSLTYITSVGSQLSGQKFRLVLDDARFVGSQALVPVKEVRKTLITFTDLQYGTTLYNGSIVFKGFNATADNNGPGYIPRFAFAVILKDADGGGELAVAEFDFYRGSVPVSSAYIFDTAGNDLTVSTPAMVGNEVVTTFDGEEVINPGATNAYSLHGAVSGVQSGDEIMIYAKTGDAYNPVEKSFLIGASNAFFADIDELRTSPSGINLGVITSDGSGDSHSFNTFADYYNGYGTGLENLEVVTLKAP